MSGNGSFWGGVAGGIATAIDIGQRQQQIDMARERADREQADWAEKQTIKQRLKDVSASETAANNEAMSPAVNAQLQDSGIDPSTASPEQLAQTRKDLGLSGYKSIPSLAYKTAIKRAQVYEDAGDHKAAHELRKQATDDAVGHGVNALLNQDAEGLGELADIFPNGKLYKNIQFSKDDNGKDVIRYQQGGQVRTVPKIDALASMLSQSSPDKAATVMMTMLQKEDRDALMERIANMRNSTQQNIADDRLAGSMIGKGGAGSKSSSSGTGTGSGGAGAGVAKMIEEAIKLDTKDSAAAYSQQGADGKPGAPVPVGELMLHANRLASDLRAANPDASKLSDEFIAQMALGAAKGDYGMVSPFKKVTRINPLTAELDVNIVAIGKGGKESGNFPIYRNVSNDSSYGMSKEVLDKAEIEFLSQRAQSDPDRMREIIAGANDPAKFNKMREISLINPTTPDQQRAVADARRDVRIMDMVRRHTPDKGRFRSDDPAPQATQKPLTEEEYNNMNPAERAAYLAGGVISGARMVANAPSAVQSGAVADPIAYWKNVASGIGRAFSAGKN